MATSTGAFLDREVPAQRALVIGGGVVGLVGLAVGAASLVTGATSGLRFRFPMYVLAGAVVFAGALLAMAHSPQNGRAVLRRAALAGLSGFTVVALGTEAVVYALVVASGLSLYLLSGAVVALGFGYWSVRNWRAVDDLTRSW